MNLTDLNTTVLHPALDAVAANNHQQRLLDRPDTREPDSVRELVQLAIEATRAQNQAATLRALTEADQLLEEVQESNQREGNSTRQVTGWADRVTENFSRSISSATSHKGTAISVTSVAVRVKTAIDGFRAWEAPAQVGAGKEASVAVSSLIALVRYTDQVPPSLLYSRQVAYAIGGDGSDYLQFLADIRGDDVESLKRERLVEVVSATTTGDKNGGAPPATRGTVMRPSNPKEAAA